MVAVLEMCVFILILMKQKLSAMKRTLCWALDT